MSKKKTQERIDAFVKEMTKEYGAGCVISGDAVKEKEVGIISVSPAHDLALGGGVSSGGTVILTGDPKFGKTVTALSIAANAQKQGRFVVFGDVEGRLKPRDLKGIHELKTDASNFRLVSSYRNDDEMRILDAEEYLDIFETAIHDIPGCVVIIDSVSALCTKRERDGDMDDQQRAETQKLMAKFCRKVANILPVNDSLLIMITHMMGNPTGYGAAKKEKGGFAISYQVDTKIRALKIDKWMDQDRQIGQSIEWQVGTSALSPPGHKYVSWLRYGHGIDEIVELTDQGIELGQIVKNGSWYTCQFMKDHLILLNEEEWGESAIKRCRGQGKAIIQQLLKDNPEWAEALKTSISRIFEPVDNE